MEVEEEERVEEEEGVDNEEENDEGEGKNVGQKKKKVKFEDQESERVGRHNEHNCCNNN